MAPVIASRVPRPPVALQAQQDWTRNNARAAGLFYLVTFVASIPAAYYFIAPALHDPNYIVGPGRHRGRRCWAIEQGSAWFVGALLVAAWELSVGIYMTFKGFRASPVTATAS